MSTENLEKLREALAEFPQHNYESADLNDAVEEAIAAALRDKAYAYFVSLDVASRYALLGYRSRDAEFKRLLSDISGLEALIIRCALTPGSAVSKRLLKMAANAIKAGKEGA